MKRLLIAIAAAVLALAACRSIIGIEDLSAGPADGATPIAEGGSSDADGDASPTDGGSDAAPDGTTPCGSRARAACISCCSNANLTQSNAVFLAEQPCACDASAGCGPVCPTYCASPAPDTAACTDCAARNLVDGGACTSSRSAGLDFARCLDTCFID